MPLPDERPRQSVANLIGRFEQQGKRQASPAIPVVPRSSSVSSQIAGDAAKEEAKEKREWPPTTAPSAAAKPPVVPTLSSSPASMSKSPAISPQPIPEPPPVNTTTTPTPASPELVKSPPAKGKATATGMSTPAAGTRRSSVTPAKSRSPNRNGSSARSSVGSPPKTTLPSSVSQPLRPHHTGQSVASNSSTVRQTRSVPRTAPSTPSRPKSSSGVPSQPVTRPKTPSSGLFAPTAASLARSRYAPPPPPPPVKKVTLSSDAAERLSKPTAASLSKARTLVPSVPSPAKTKSSAATHASVRTPSKPKDSRTSVRPKAARPKGEIRSDPASASSEPDPLVADPVENGNEPGTATCSDVGSPQDAHDQPEVAGGAAHDFAADEHTQSDPGVLPVQQGDEHVEEEDVHERVSQDYVEEEEQIHSDVHEDHVSAPAETHTPEVIGNGDSFKGADVASGNDIEDIVNLLEGASISKPRPQSMVSIPDENPDDY